MLSKLVDIVVAVETDLGRCVTCSAMSVLVSQLILSALRFVAAEARLVLENMIGRYDIG